MRLASSPFGAAGGVTAGNGRTARQRRSCRNAGGPGDLRRDRATAGKEEKETRREEKPPRAQRYWNVRTPGGFTHLSDSVPRTFD